MPILISYFLPVWVSSMRREYHDDDDDDDDHGNNNGNRMMDLRVSHDGMVLMM